MNILKNRGTSVYYFNKNSKELAEILEKNLSKKINTRKDGTKTGSFAVIRPTDYVGVLIEVAYMTNPLDTVIYKSDSFIENSTEGILEGLLEFINKNWQ